MCHIEAIVRVEIGNWKLEMTDALNLGSEVDVDTVLHVFWIQSVGFNVLLHIVSLNKSSKKFYVSKMI